MEKLSNKSQRWMRVGPAGHGAGGYLFIKLPSDLFITHKQLDSTRRPGENRPRTTKELGQYQHEPGQQNNTDSWTREHKNPAGAAIMIRSYRNTEPCWALYLRATNAGDSARYLGNRSLAKAKIGWFVLSCKETKCTATQHYSWCIPRAFKCFLALKQLNNLLELALN